MPPPTIPSKDFPGQQLQPAVLYSWLGLGSDVAHAFRGGTTGFLRSVCHWQRWTTRMVEGGRHCRDCAAVVEYELAQAAVALGDADVRSASIRTERLMDWADR